MRAAPPPVLVLALACAGSALRVPLMSASVSPAARAWSRAVPEHQVLSFPKKTESRAIGDLQIRVAAGVANVLRTLPSAATATAALLAFDELALPAALTVWCSLEAAHHIVSLSSSRVGLGKSYFAPERGDDEQVELWRRCLDDPTTTAENLILGWFFPTERAGRPNDGDTISVELAELRRGNVEEWLSYALYSVSADVLDTDRRALLERAVCMLEDRIGYERRQGRTGRRRRRRAGGGEPAAATATAMGDMVAPGEQPRDGVSPAAASGREAAGAPAGEFRFQAGFNKAIRSMRLNLDPPSCNTQQRPLFYYALTDGLIGGLVTPAVMRARGFTLHRLSTSPSSAGLSYWYHPGMPRSPAEESGGAEDATARRPTTPLVFVHGVGIGPLPYAGFISRMLANADGAPVMVIELPFVAQRISGISRAPSEEQTTNEIAAAMARHGIEHATFVGHSLGTIYLSWLARRRPDLLASCVFIDPIVFLLHHHNVAQSFLYSRPDGSEPLETVQRYFIKSERSIVSYFHRHFYWFSCILWKHELQAPSAVVLATDDRIVPVEAVTRYLLGDDARGVLARLLRRPARPSGGGATGSAGGGASAGASSERKSSIRRVLTLDGLSHGSFLVEEGATEAILATVRDAQEWGARHTAHMGSQATQSQASDLADRALWRRVVRAVGGRRRRRDLVDEGSHRPLEPRRLVAPARAMPTAASSS